MIPITTDQLSDMVWARLAAFIDGEGCIILCHRKRTKGDVWLRITMVNVDPRLPKWCKETFGGHCIYEPRSYIRSTHRPIWRWNVNGARAAWVLRGCLPYFLLKREQAELALAFQETVRYWGKSKMPDDVAEHRQRLRTELSDLKKIAYGPDMCPIN